MKLTDQNAVQFIEGGHVYRTKPSSTEVNMFAWEKDYHNGPICVVCSECICEHCSMNWRAMLCDEAHPTLSGLEFPMVEKG